MSVGGLLPRSQHLNNMLVKGHASLTGLVVGELVATESGMATITLAKPFTVIRDYSYISGDNVVHIQFSARTTRWPAAGTVIGYAGTLPPALTLIPGIVPSANRGENTWGFYIDTAGIITIGGTPDGLLTNVLITANGSYKLSV